MMIIYQAFMMRKTFQYEFMGNHPCPTDMGGFAYLKDLTVSLTCAGLTVFAVVTGVTSRYTA